MFKGINILTHEVGLKFRRGEFVGIVEPGRHWVFDPLGITTVAVSSRRNPWIVHESLDVIVRSKLLGDEAEVVDLKEHERALVWIDGRFRQILGSGTYAYWKGFRDVVIERVDVHKVRFEHESLRVIASHADARAYLDIATVERHRAGVLFVGGEYVATLAPGLYAFWRTGDAKVVDVDLRELMIDLVGQEIMTADKVTLRLNAVLTYKVIDPRQALATAEDLRQAIYREAQFALRSSVGLRDLDALLADKDAIVRDATEMVRERTSPLGVSVSSVGVRDVILPGEMKELFNKVTEAKKAAEANLISRREETAAIRSQASTAKLLQDNPTLMRLRELELLEKIASTGKLSIVLGEKGLSDRVVNML